MLALSLFSLIGGSCRLSYDCNLCFTVFNSHWNPRETVTSIANSYVNFSQLGFVSLCSFSLALYPQNIKLSSQPISFVETIISSVLSSFSSHRYHLGFFLLQPFSSVNLKTTAYIFNSLCNSYQGWV